MDTAQLLDAVTQRVSVLVAEQAALRAQLMAAQARVRELEDARDDRQDQDRELRQQENITRMAGLLAADPTAATDLKLRINDYLREVERCIAYLKD